MIRFQCPSCSSVLQVPPENAGSVVACGKCAQRLRVPYPKPQGQAADEKPYEVPLKPTTVAPKSAARPAAQPEPAAPPRWSAAGRALTVVLWLLVLGGGAGGWFVYQAYFADDSGGEPLPRLEEPPSANKGKPGPSVPDKKLLPITGKTKEPEPDNKQPPILSDEEKLNQALLKRINARRQLEERLPISLDADLCRVCREHAEYLARNWPTNPDLDPHAQEDDLPASTADGKAFARWAHVSRREPEEALRGWLLGPAHSAWLVREELKSFGFAAVRDKDGQWFTVFDWGNRTSAPKHQGNDPVLFPSPGQSNVPTTFPGEESPDPLPDASNKLAGWPITAMFPAATPVVTGQVWLEDEDGSEVAVWFSSPVKPANKKHEALQQNTLCLFAKSPLRPGTRYLVKLSTRAGKQDWNRIWTFVTESPAEPNALRYGRAMYRINTFRRAAELGPLSLDPILSRACRAHADYLADNIDQATLDVKKQDESLPGYTKEGAAIARTAAVRLGGGDTSMDAVDWLLTSVAHRQLALMPGAEMLGLGMAYQGKKSPRGAIWVIHPQTGKIPATRQVVLYPGKDQKDVPLHYGWAADMVLPADQKGTMPGFGISALFVAPGELKQATAKLFDSEGTRIDCYLSTPTKPLPGVGPYKQIVLIPKKTLSANYGYKVMMSAEVGGKLWSESWSFTTLSPKRYREENARKMAVLVNKAREEAGLAPVVLDETLSQGCLKHAIYVATNLDDPRVQGLGVHDEHKDLTGYTKEGEKAGEMSVIAVLTDPLSAGPAWMATLYHRIPLLDPRLKRIGYGQALNTQKGWVVVLDAGSGRGP